MHRKSILRSIPCDLKKLPIGALEAFVLSQVHGRSTAEDVAEAAGLEIGELLRVARHLVDLGALASDDEKRRTKAPPARAASRVAKTTNPPGNPTKTLVPAAVVPVARRHADLRSLGLSPRDGFVLSQVDGKTSTADLSEITSLSQRDLSAALRALEAAGVVDLGSAAERPSKAARAPAPPAASRRLPRADEEPCELADVERARIVEAGARLEGLDHYATLGIERDADAKAIRHAYHALAARFHPDRFFGKKLGPMRRPLDRIFGKLTVAYETLSHAGKRTAYDGTLPPRPHQRAPTQKPPKTPTRKSLRAARKPGTARPPPPAPPAPPPAPAPTQPRPHFDRQRLAALEHVEVFVRAAREALDRDDLVGAANHYRLAVQVSSDPSLRAALEDVVARARKRGRDAPDGNRD